MSTYKPAKGKSLATWLIIGLVVVVFVGAQQLHPGGISGLLKDFFTESSTSSEVQRLRDKMLASLLPMGAAAICLKEHGENTELRNAVVSYNDRNQAMMKALIASVEAAGGMSKSEKDLLDRQAYREARSFVDQDRDTARTCSGLANRIRSGEFDLRAN